MDADNKKFMGAVIDCMKEEDQTNLWHGLMEGVKLFGDGANTGRVPAIMLLTDGCPNHMLVRPSLSLRGVRILMDSSGSPHKDISPSSGPRHPSRPPSTPSVSVIHSDRGS